MLPSELQWQKALEGPASRYTYSMHSYLVAYLAAAWQYRFRQQLGHPLWTPADAAAAFNPPLHKEVLVPLALLAGLGGWSRQRRPPTLLWASLRVGSGRRCRPPPVTADEMRDRCLAILASFYLHSVRLWNDNLQDDEIISPIEIDPRTWLTLPGEERTIMYEQGRHPFRIKVPAGSGLYLVTTDAGDGSDDDADDLGARRPRTQRPR